ncbi:hypothetical protein DAEQUDRAFT_429165 [Daedalea quercina L-15889]|uniref:Uncharacterized protein n=1 Tax=Daedalea quercina L-15889 TaxID=1314783 RepID=A0A165NJS8_9APHY|nr:hypothetical protein DAEQUDRAFT_429165 [Daedalea quercina L-15889]
MWPFSSPTAEREYVSLLYKATACYASWDPLRPVRVGDYGRLQHDGSFAPEGNIFDEGLAERYKIDKSTHGQDELRYIVSDNGKEISVAPDVDISLESIVEGHVKCKVAFSKGRGALLAMLRPRLAAITYPGRLSRLLADQRDWRDFVLVSEVYTCRSYARLLTYNASREVTVGLGANVPIAPAIGLPVNVGGDVDVHWKTDCRSGDWKSAHYDSVLPRGAKHAAENPETGNEADRSGTLCYPLFKLVALRRPHGAPVSTVRGTFDYELPVAVPPWMEQHEEESEDAMSAEEGEEVPKPSWKDWLKCFMQAWISRLRQQAFKL